MDQAIAWQVSRGFGDGKSKEEADLLLLSLHHRSTAITTPTASSPTATLSSPPSPSTPKPFLPPSAPSLQSLPPRNASTSASSRVEFEDLAPSCAPRLGVGGRRPTLVTGEKARVGFYIKSTRRGRGTLELSTRASSACCRGGFQLGEFLPLRPLSPSFDR
ncbi:hypothetical protein BCR35DRAFT_165542 [Leucosporidium creatinivorum]|uniref:Uncharacterized protein n=1 Tax=Leucosporidium creatinivorum TaxID=106004 RepID=A0A1Y2ELZ9_9BASI|nr:hypothetical protein BCR35DRAFT_165542 [Leucosporidium creatinivorum]